VLYIYIYIYIYIYDISHLRVNNKFHLACIDVLYALSYHYAALATVTHTFRSVFHYVNRYSCFVCFVLFFVTRHMEPANCVTCNRLNNPFQY